MRDDLHITRSASNIAVSITALFSGIFIVVAGGLADQFGRVKLTNIGVCTENPIRIYRMIESAKLAR